MLEEAPSVALTDSLRNKIGETAVRAAKAAGYMNAGTVEFLLDVHSNFYFMEMNTRVQVEHPVTEAITGIDIVKEQLRIASGEKLGYTQRDIGSRVMPSNAGSPRRSCNGFSPSSGLIKSVLLPGGFGVRVDTHVYSGYCIPPYYDSLLAKLIVWAPERADAISRMARCLSEFTIEGLKTNIPFHQKIMANAFYQRGELSTSFIKRRMGNGG